MSIRWSRRVALACALLAFPAQAAAQTTGPSSATERARFKAAQQLYDGSDFAGALPLFQDVVRIGGSPNARLYAARCLRELGRLAEAYEELTVTMRDADARAAKEPRYAATRDAAAAERAAISSKVGLLVLAIEERPAGLSVKIGGNAIEEERLGRPFAVAPGTITVEASATGRTPFKREVTIRGGAQEAIAITLPAPSSAPPAPPAAPEKGGSIRKAGFAVAGVGAAGWVLFAVAAPVADDKYKQVFAACGGTRCADPAYSSEISTGRALDTAANVGLVIGIVGVTAGAAMIVFGGPRSDRVSAGFSPGGGWLTYQHAF
jgi:hypothetical protein